MCGEHNSLSWQAVSIAPSYGWMRLFVWLGTATGIFVFHRNSPRLSQKHLTTSPQHQLNNIIQVGDQPHLCRFCGCELNRHFPLAKDIKGWSLALDSFPLACMWPSLNKGDKFDFVTKGFRIYHLKFQHYLPKVQAQTNTSKIHHRTQTWLEPSVGTSQDGNWRVWYVDSKHASFTSANFHPVEGSYWFYAPNKGAPVVFAFLFAVSVVWHVYQCL